VPLRLKRLKVEGFRSFSGEVVVEFDDCFTVIYGPSGSGKTSIARAIEFALFGATRELSSRALRKEDLINDAKEEARVELTLTDGQGDICIVRTLNRNGRSTLAVRASGSEFFDEMAEHFLRSRVRCELDEFAREYSIGYQELYSLLHAPPAEQGELIDALLGISEVKELYEAISPRGVRDALNRLKEEERKLGGEVTLNELKRLKEEYIELIGRRDRLVHEIDKLESRKRALEEELKIYKLDDAEIEKLKVKLEILKEQLKQLEEGRALRAVEVDESYLLELAESARARLTSVLEQCFMGEDAQRVSQMVLSLDNLPDFIKVVDECVNKVHLECLTKLAIEQRELRGRMSQVQAQVNRIEEELSSVQAEIERRKHARAEYEQLVKTYGDPATLARKIAKLEVELRALSREEGKATCAHVLLGEVVEILKKEGKAMCPICGRVIEDASSLPKLVTPETLAIRRERVEREVEELREVERKLKELELELKVLKDMEDKRAQLEEELERALDELEELRASYEELEDRISFIRDQLALFSRDRERLLNAYNAFRYLQLSKEVRALESRLRELGYDEVRVKEILNELDRIKNDISSKRGTLSEIERQERELSGKINEYNIIARKLEMIKKKEERLNYLLEKVEKVRKAILNSHSVLRQRLAAVLSKEASSLFARFGASFDYESIVVGVESPRASGSRYTILAVKRGRSQPVAALARFSDGQKSLLALSLFLATRKLKPRSLPFLILDDPVPNVDERTKCAVARVLYDLSGEMQVVLTTQSEEVARELGARARVIDLSGLARHS